MRKDDLQTGLTMAETERQEEMVGSLNQLIATLLTFMQLFYRGNDIYNTPFKTHPKSMRLALSTSVAYQFVAAALLRFPPPRHLTHLAHHFLAWSAYATVAALTSVLSPPLAAPFIYSAFVFIAALEFLYYKLVPTDDGGKTADIEKEEDDDHKHQEKDGGAISGSGVCEISVSGD